MSAERISLVAQISRRLFISIGVLILALVGLGLLGGSLWPSQNESRTLPAGAAASTADSSAAVSGGDSQAVRSPPMVLVVIGLGALGGFVGLQRRLKNLPKDDLRLLATSWLHALLSPLVGGVLALVMYALFMSGLLAGELFPRLCPATAKTGSDTYANLLGCAPESVSAYAKLFFWSFVAGFSERFVVDIIGRFEHQANPPPDDGSSPPAGT